MPKGAGRDSATVPFHYVTNITLTAGSAALQLNPSLLGTAIGAVSDAYQLWRFQNLRFRIFAQTATAAVGVVGSIPNTLPGTINDIGELMDSVRHLSTVETTWSRWVSVTKPVRSGPLPWYHTRAGTFAVTEVYPCTMVFIGSGTNAIALEVYGTIQFKDLSPIDSTPAVRSMRLQVREVEEKVARERERTRLLEALAPSAK